MGIRFSGYILAVVCILGLTVPVEANFRAESLEVVEHHAVEAMREVWDFEAGELTEEATEELLEEAVLRASILPEGNEHKEDLEVIAEAAEAELAKPKMHLYNVCTITRYCNCAQCCGPWAGGNTASGVPPIPGRTVAHNYLPFGTRVLINGQEYVVEDRGDANMAGGDWFDVFVADHRTATGPGMYTAEVYIIDG